jgi:hypothetical protein
MIDIKKEYVLHHLNALGQHLSRRFECLPIANSKSFLWHTGVTPRDLNKGFQDSQPLLEQLVKELSNYIIEDTKVSHQKDSKIEDYLRNLESMMEERRVTTYNEYNSLNDKDATQKDVDLLQALYHLKEYLIK